MVVVVVVVVVVCEVGRCILNKGRRNICAFICRFRAAGAARAGGIGGEG